MNQVTRLLLMCFVVCFSILAHAKKINVKGEPELDVTCESYTIKRPWPYCIIKTIGSENSDLLYFFHEAGESEHQWIKDWSTIRYAWKKNNKQAPTVITMSFGPTWLLTEKNSRPTSGLLTWFMQTQVPILEEKAGGLKPGGRRIAMAKSMGGYNALQVLLKYPKMFSRMALVSPALMNISPFAKKELVEDYIRRTGAEPAKAKWVPVMFKSFYAEHEQWAQATPMVETESKFNTETAPLYVSYGTKDNWGFHEGVDIFINKALKAGTSVTWESIPGGGHHSFNPETIAEFLVP